MEGIAPPLDLLLAIKREIEKGSSVRMGLLRYLEKADNSFFPVVKKWLSCLEQGQETEAILNQIESIFRKNLLLTLERGLNGEPIYQALCGLEEEIILACEDEISRKIASLPFALLVPLLLFQFPAFLMLLFGPLLQNFFHSLGGG